MRGIASHDKSIIISFYPKHYNVLKINNGIVITYRNPNNLKPSKDLRFSFFKIIHFLLQFSEGIAGYDKENWSRKWTIL